MNVNLEIFSFKVDDEKRKLLNRPVNFDLIDKNKYANNSEYVPESVYKRILNEMTNGMWSFVPHSIDIIDDGKKPYVRFIGLLIVPGFGIHTGIGTQALDKKDNQNATAAAKTYAFKNACKEMGLAPNVGDDTWEEELFEYDEEFDFEEEEKPKKKKNKKKENAKPSAKRPTKLKDRIKEVREAYELDDDDDFVAFIQIWDDSILELDDMDEEDWEDFLDYLENNKEKFEDF